MNIIDLVKTNEKLIESFNTNQYIKTNKVSILGAIAALETTNEIQKFYLNDNSDKKVIGEKLMNLYGFLQSLFVSIDGLYAMSQILYGHKDYLNINKNVNMREIRYIRNDVVGHPANPSRSRGRKNCYCILDKSSVETYSFKYHIISESESSIKEVFLIDLLKAYYECSNECLRLYLNNPNKNLSNTTLIIKNILENYPNDFTRDFNNFNRKYKGKNTRISWFSDQIIKLSEYLTNQRQFEHDIIYFYLTKIYKILTNENYDADFSYTNITKKLINIFKNNKELFKNKNILQDIKHPYFNNYYKLFIKQVKKYKSLASYLEKIENFEKNKNSDMFYSYLFFIKLI